MISTDVLLFFLFFFPLWSMMLVAKWLAESGWPIVGCAQALESDDWSVDTAVIIVIQSHHWAMFSYFFRIELMLTISYVSSRYPLFQAGDPFETGTDSSWFTGLASTRGLWSIPLSTPPESNGGHVFAQMSGDFNAGNHQVYGQNIVSWWFSAFVRHWAARTSRDGEPGSMWVSDWHLLVCFTCPSTFVSMVNDVGIVDPL